MAHLGACILLMVVSEENVTFFNKKIGILHNLYTRDGTVIDFFPCIVVNSTQDKLTVLNFYYMNSWWKHKHYLELA